MDLLDSYRANGPGHDEMLQATGPARAAWQQLAEQARLGQGDRLDASRGEVMRLLQDEGVLTTDPARSWQLDPLPVLMDEHEWHRLDAALRQRAELFDQVLTDLYGERRLLTTGLLPPEVVLGHPGFVHAADRIRLPGPHQLFHCAIDLARNADGAWTVLADRTDVPIGLGYVMADRRVVSEVLAGLYRESRTRRVGPYYQALRESLQAVAPPGAEESPRVAVLTPGPGDPTRFDHGYLAAMLGLPIVDSGDLVVQDGRVWVRALGRLEPVDVLLRGVAAADVDPLELSGGSGRGTPGLVHAARSGALSVVNTLGVGVLESPALLTYLPRLARALRGEDLAIPSAVTYWCGDRSMCSHVIANLGRLIIRPAAGAERPLLGWALTLDERADLAARIAERPGAWVGQEPVEASTTPTVRAGSLVPQPTALRTFALARPEGYMVMSGAMAHVGPVPQVMVDGEPGTAKDVWVLAPEPVAAPGLPAGGTLPGRPADATVSPRAGEDLFRLGRHTEQAESTVRLLMAVADRWDDYARPQPAAAQDARPAGAVVPEDHLSLPRGDAAGHAALDVLVAGLHRLTAHAQLPALVTDESLPGSAAWAVARTAEDAAGVRDNLPRDLWRAIASLQRTVREEAARQRGADGTQLGLAPALSRLLESLMALQGGYGESLVRDAGWRLLEAGRRLERARRVVATLAATVVERHDPATEALVAESVLVANESVLTYRRRFPAGGLAGVLELLLLDGSNPRAVRFQLDQLRRHLGELPAVGRAPASRDQLLDEVVDLLTELRTDRAAAERGHGARAHLAQSLESIGWRLDELAKEIARVHFARPVLAHWPDGTRR
ncbi:circularly permuted type 2 ATP-grasp protein [Georgenia yuyongxinii]|uniref:Uncharacterized protein n=1 Tax=Georgenia yuyongxinii TaxID=2589797 RepID=A0A552WW21_9MICO|nr:circularly permuted type 2 ATP-grasp protein [Georgenia yuyongxinii]TRW46967.1 hypothetical protein FJ693_03010 [Georgenia yuyongxinii]